MANSNLGSFLFEGIFTKPVHSRFDSELRTSDGGASLLGVIDRRLGITEALSSHLSDSRDPNRVEHTVLDLIRQRVFSIALGYVDCNDSARVSQDPAMKLLCGRRPSEDRPLASQPTLSRFEHSVTAKEATLQGRAFEQAAIGRLRSRHRKPKLITIDLDPSVDPAHGQQPLAFFTGYYKTTCYLPMFGFISADGDPEQYLFYARLRPGRSKEMRGTIPLLRRMVKCLRSTFGKPRIRIRLDGGFAYPRLFEVLEELGVEYLVAMPENSVLSTLAVKHMHAARILTESFGSSTALFGDGRYQSKSWPHERRAVFKAEVVRIADTPLKDNARFVITNLRQKPEKVWNIYRKRGDPENRIKELKNDLEIDRTSCNSFVANQVRVLLTATAYVLFQELRSALSGSELARGQVSTLRLRLLKIGATITESFRRVVVSMSSSHPWKELWGEAAARVLAKG